MREEMENKSSFYNFHLNKIKKEESKESKERKEDEDVIKKKNDLYLSSLSDEELLEKIKKDKVLLLEFDGINQEELKRRRKIYDKYLCSMIGYEITDPYVKVYEKSIPDDLCDEIIKRFNEDNQKRDGVTSSGINKNIKHTKDLMMSRYDNWKDIDSKMFTILNKSLNEYMNYLIENNLNMYSGSIDTDCICDKGYNIQKYNKNDGFYIWHTDDMVSYQHEEARIITYLWYLNDIEEGGETYFRDFKIKPEKGKLVFFPATWTYGHKGAVPISDDKYIVTGWIVEKRSYEIEKRYYESITNHKET